MSDDRHEAVSRRAYELWEKEGGEHGRHEDHWHRAADEVGKGGDDTGAKAETPDAKAAPAKKVAAKPRAKATPAKSSGEAAPAKAATAPAAKPPKTKSPK